MVHKKSNATSRRPHTVTFCPFPFKLPIKYLQYHIDRYIWTIPYETYHIDHNKCSNSYKIIMTDYRNKLSINRYIQIQYQLCSIRLDPLEKNHIIWVYIIWTHIICRHIIWNYIMHIIIFSMSYVIISYYSISYRPISYGPISYWIISY